MAKVPLHPSQCGASCWQTAGPELNTGRVRSAGAAALGHRAGVGSCVNGTRVTAPADIFLGLRKFGPPGAFVDEVE